MIKHYIFLYLELKWFIEAILGSNTECLKNDRYI